MPTLMLWGEQDQVIPFACAPAYRQGIAQAKLVSLAETGHPLPVERPAAVAAAIDDFMSSLA